MKTPMSRRAWIRLLLFLGTAILLLLVKNILLMRENSQSALIIETGYLRAVEELSQATENISNTLSKELYAATPQMQSRLSAKLLAEAGAAKTALSQLPVSGMRLENTNKFLSQVGNYAVYLSEKSAKGGDITDEEYKALSQLYEYSKRLSTNMWSIEQMISAGKIEPEEVASSLTNSDIQSGDVPDVTDGFLEFEEGFSDYPSLIYDGPFSDHIMQKKSAMLESLDEVSVSGAKAVASKALGTTPSKLSESGDEASSIDAYSFRTDEASISISKKGGLIVYMLKNRNPSDSKISAKNAISKADKYLDYLDIDNMEVTYYESLGNVCTINYAYKDDGVIVYGDLIKVKVALDNGEILGFDARGFIMNHRERDFKKPKLSEDEAKKSVSKMLEIENVKLASIPLSDTTEGYCYEFTCVNKSDNHVLIYVDCMTGEEKEILMLFESEGGTLAM